MGLISAERMENALVEYLAQQQLPDDWKRTILDRLGQDEGQKRAQQEIRAIVRQASTTCVCKQPHRPLGTSCRSLGSKKS